MKNKDKISIRCELEDDAINKALKILAIEKKYNIDIERINLRFDGVSNIYDIYYCYDVVDNEIPGNHYEIERKFLVLDDSIKLNYDYEQIVQNYIGFNPVSRIRKVNGKYYFTEKSIGKMIRKENEREISEDDYLKLLDYKIGRTIRKNRYKIPLSDELFAELDVYLDELSGLKTVEVEFSSILDAELFNIPQWFGLEVTNDERYKNDKLALESLDEINRLMLNSKRL